MTPISILLKLADENALTSDAFARALSAVKVRGAKAGATAAKIADGGGLALYVPPSGAKTWRYRFRLDGKEQTLTLGGYPEVSLEHARQAHRAARWLVERGQSPLRFITEAIEQAKAQEAADELSTFGAVGRQWVDRTDGALAPSTRKHRRAMLDKHVYPKLADKKIADIRRRELVEVLGEIDRAAPETAKYCRGYIKQIFEHALALELVLGNPTPDGKALVNYSSRKATPRKALPLSKLGEFLNALDCAADTDPLTKAAMQLLVLTWTRTQEVTGARWVEFDLDARVWVIPADRMKADEPHTVYLSKQAVAVLGDLKKLSHGEYLFPNKRDRDRPMGRTTLYQWRSRQGFGDVMDIHGFRAVSSTWANESGKYRPDVIEAALAHKEQDRIRAAYNRAKFIDELRGLWQEWADLCDTKVAAAKAANVVNVEFGRVA